MYMRRQGETEALGGFVGKMFPYIYDEYRRGLDRNKDGDGTGFVPIRDTGAPGPTGGDATGRSHGNFYFQYKGRDVFRDPFTGKVHDANSGEEVPIEFGSQDPLSTTGDIDTTQRTDGGQYFDPEAFAQSFMGVTVEPQTKQLLDQTYGFTNPGIEVSLPQYPGVTFFRDTQGYWRKR
jgi:hypothetical protein